MAQNKKAITDLSINTLSNVSVVGFALGLYEQKWWCMVIAAIAYGAAYYIAGRSE